MLVSVSALMPASWWLHLVNPRQQQEHDGSRRLLIDADRVWKLADRVGVPLPARFSRPPSRITPLPTTTPTVADLDARGWANVRTALGRP